MSTASLSSAQRVAYAHAYAHYIETYTAEVGDYVRRAHTGQGSVKELREGLLPSARLLAGTCSAAKQRFDTLATLHDQRHSSGPAPAKNAVMGSSGSSSANEPVSVGLQKFETGTKGVYEASYSDFNSILSLIGASNPSDLHARLQRHAGVILSALTSSVMAPAAAFADRSAERNRRAPAALDAIADAIVSVRALGHFAGHSGTRTSAADFGQEAPSTGAFLGRDAAPVNKAHANAFLSDIAATSAIRRRLKVVDVEYWAKEFAGYQDVTYIDNRSWTNNVRQEATYTSAKRIERDVTLLEGSAVLAGAASRTYQVWAALPSSEDAMHGLLLSYPPTMDGYVQRELFENTNFFGGFVDHLRMAARC